MFRLLNSVRGWDTTHTPAQDAKWALGEIARRLGGRPPACLVGHSLGGRGALLAATQPEVVSVVALAPWVYPDDVPDGLDGQRILFVHGSRDRIASPARSAALARNLGSARLGRLCDRGGRQSTRCSAGTRCSAASPPSSRPLRCSGAGTATRSAGFRTARVLCGCDARRTPRTVASGCRLCTPRAGLMGSRLLRPVPGVRAQITDSRDGLSTVWGCRSPIAITCSRCSAPPRPNTRGCSRSYRRGVVPVLRATYDAQEHAAIIIATRLDDH